MADEQMLKRERLVGWEWAIEKIKSHAYSIGLRIDNWGDSSVEDTVNTIIAGWLEELLSNVPLDWSCKQCGHESLGLKGDKCHCGAVTAEPSDRWLRAAFRHYSHFVLEDARK